LEEQVLESPPLSSQFLESANLNQVLITFLVSIKPTKWVSIHSDNIFQSSPKLLLFSAEQFVKTLILST
jgi:hypothetical protein